MKFDVELISMARKRVRDKRCEQEVRKAASEALDKLEHDYEVACFLSNGPDRSRSAYWLQRAKTRKLELYAFIDRDCEPQQKFKNRIPLAA